MPDDPDDWIIPPPQPPMILLPEGHREVLLWSEHLAALKKKKFPGAEKLLGSAKKVDIDGEGDVVLIGTVEDIKWLAGFVAGEANHLDRHGPSRQADLWAEISERFECADW
jgi:hypothetical protein